MLAHELERLLRRDPPNPVGFRWEGTPYMVMLKRLHTVYGVLHLECFHDEIGLMSLPVAELKSFFEEGAE